MPSGRKTAVLTGLFCLFLFVASLPGILRLQVETDFSRNFKDSSSIVQSLKFVESRLGGAGSWEIAFDTPERLNDEFLNDIKRLTQELRDMATDDDSITILSLTDISNLPPRIFGPAKTLQRIARKQPSLISNFYNEGSRRMRIVLRSAEQQPSEKKLAQITSIRSCVAKFFASTEFKQQTRPGSFRHVCSAGRIDPESFAGSVAQFSCRVLWHLCLYEYRVSQPSHRSFVFVPECVPVAILMGILGWSGVQVNIGTAMITSVSMGLTVDSTIHYITAV